MKSVKEAWRKAGKINNWDGAEDIDADHPDVISSYTPLVDGWKFIRSDGVLLTIVTLQMALVTWLIAETVFLANAIPIWVKDSLSVVGMLLITGLSCQLGWAAMAARADDMFAERTSGLATLGRTIRGTLFLMPFGAIPALFLSRILSIFVPVRLVSLRLWFGYDGFEIPARYWHLMTGIVGAARGVTLAKAADLTVDCRLKVYDIAAEDSRRYRAGLAIGFLIMPVMAGVFAIWPQFSYAVGLPVLFYMGIVIYHQAPAIVCLTHVLHTDFKDGHKEPWLPSGDSDNRANFLIYGAYGVAYALLMYVAVAIPVGKDLLAYDMSAIDPAKIEAECKEKILTHRLGGIEEIQAYGQRIESCIEDARNEQKHDALMLKRTLSQAIEDYIAINKAGKSPTIIRANLER